MVQDSRWAVPNPVTKFAGPETEVHILNAVHVALVKSSQTAEQIPSDQQTRPGDHIHVPGNQGRGVVCGSVSMHMVRHPVYQLDAGVLDLPRVRVEQARPHNADLRVGISLLHERVEPPLVGHRIVVEE